jgi:hypothetical protein
MDADELALRLDVNLRTRGVCYPCLGEVAHNLKTRKRRGGEIEFVGNLWAEGLGDSVAFALGTAVALGLPGALDAQQDLLARGRRSDIFRAVVRRLALELDQETERAFAAWLN